MTAVDCSSGTIVRPSTTNRPSPGGKKRPAASSMLAPGPSPPAYPADRRAWVEEPVQRTRSAPPPAPMLLIRLDADPPRSFGMSLARNYQRDFVPLSSVVSGPTG